MPRGGKSGKTRQENAVNFYQKKVENYSIKMSSYMLDSGNC